MDVEDTGIRPQALVVYESMFGNTEAIANAIADGLAERTEVAVIPTTAAASLPPALRLLVVGGPTHAFGMSRPNTRRDAGTKGARPHDAAGIGVREWLDQLPGLPDGLLAATFATKVRRPRLPGSAAGAVRRRLRRMGVHTIAEPANFYVGGTAGPLLDGERQRARRWGERLGVELGVTVGGATATGR